MAEAATRKMQLICIHTPPVSDEWVHYTRYLADLLGVDPAYRETATPAGEQDLILFHEPPSSWWQRILGWTVPERLARRGPASVLAVRHLRWPLTRILLIFRATPADAAAVAWASALAGPAGAAVTVLPILPPIPALYAPLQGPPVAVDRLLAANTPAAMRLRRLSEQFACWQIPATIHLGWGEPLWQLRTEMAAGAYDLVIAGADPAGWLYRFLVGDLVGPLLRCAGCPVLVARNLPGRHPEEVRSLDWQTSNYFPFR